jgi:tetraacyldisaccharide 4'-kinase
VDIVVVDQALFDRAGSESRRLLPAGNLREPLYAMKRADALIVNRKFSAPAPVNDPFAGCLRAGARVFTTRYQAVGFIDIRDNKFFAPDEFRGQKSVIVCGIANPDSFFAALNSIGVNTDDRIIFIDHKFYAIEQVQRIRKEFYAKNSYSVITTQKDAVKLSGFKKELDDIDIYYLKIEMVPDDEAAFEQYITETFNDK